MSAHAAVTARVAVYFRFPLRVNRCRFRRSPAVRFLLPPCVGGSKAMLLQLPARLQPWALVAVPGRFRWQPLGVREIAGDAFGGRAAFVLDMGRRSRGVFYRVALGGAWSCDCAGFTDRDHCRHVAAAIALFARAASPHAA